jgi:GTP:adenosylcobinamide-phosphate guanylyltransferase
VNWAVIQARGGSKGLPGKHLRLLAGKPLLAHTIEAARAADRIVVSTDDPAIAEVARAWGAEVPFLRPAELATDRASVRDAVWYTIDRLVAEEGREPFGIGLLFATSPIRPPGLLAELLRRLDGAYCATTVFRVPDLRRLHRMAPDGTLSPVGDLTNLVKSVGLGTAIRYVPPGARPFESRGRFLAWARETGTPTEWSFVAVDDPRYLIDIDYARDLERAERLCAG